MHLNIVWNLRHTNYCHCHYCYCFNPKIIFRNTHRIKSFSPIKTGSPAPLGLKKFIRLAAGIVMIAMLGKQNVDCMTGKRNTSKRWRVTAILLPLLIIWPKRRVKRDHFDILVSGQSDIYCKIKETLKFAI